MTTLARSDQSFLAEWWRRIDHGTISACMFLLIAGLILSLAVSPTATARINISDPYYFVYRHALFAAASFAVLIAVSMLDDRGVRRLAGAVFVGAFLSMAFIFLVGYEAKGSQRWIQLGPFSLQPSEFVKPALIVLTAWLIAQRDAFPKVPWALLAFAFYAPTAGLLLLQPDIGQTALLSSAFVVTFFVAGLPLRWALGFIAGGAGLATALYNTVPHVKYRVDAFLNPEGNDTFQVGTAQQAIMDGGLMGVGPGEGRIKAQIPDAQTDFIYSVAGEEFGFVACLGLMIIFAVITVRGILSASRQRDVYRRAAATGLFYIFGAQACINIAVNLSLLPAKGMTLPFISYGGSSMLGIALTLGLALALTRKRPEFVRPVIETA